MTSGAVRWWVLPQTTLETNCYVLASANSPEAFVIDCGEDADEVLALVAREGLTVARLIATHGHADHIGGFARLREVTGAPFAIHSGDETLARTRQAAAVVFLGWVPDPVEVDETLTEGQVLALGEARFTVLHTPGHTPGCVCVMGEGLLLAGDTLFAGSIGRTDLPGGDGRQMAESLRRLSGLDPSLEVLPGHGPTTTLDVELDTNPFLA
jgi:hydroxyacylglutathione hydrolase